jgi:hypothetical protein
MPLRVPNPPERGLGIILEALSSAVNQPTNVAAAIEEVGAAGLTTAAPHQVYFVGLRDLAEGRLLAATQLKGWRYIIFEGERPMAAAELSGGGGGDDALDFSNINHGPFVASTVEGVQRAEGLEAVREEDYELRLLDIPGLYVVALWLHGARELIIPLPPTRDELEPFAVYEEEEVIERLRASAERRLNFDDRPRSEGRR